MLYTYDNKQEYKRAFLQELGIKVSAELFILVEDEEKKMVTGSSHFCFLIGGPYGNSDLLRKRAQLRFCLGQITLTHQTILAIQIA